MLTMPNRRVSDITPKRTRHQCRSAAMMSRPHAVHTTQSTHQRRRAHAVCVRACMHRVAGHAQNECSRDLEEPIPLPPCPNARHDRSRRRKQSTGKHSVRTAMQVPVAHISPLVALSCFERGTQSVRVWGAARAHKKRGPWDSHRAGTRSQCQCGREPPAELGAWAHGD